VGKTNFAVNLAIAIRQMGHQVILLDMDLGLANVDLLMGIKPRYNLFHVVGRGMDILEALVPAPGDISVVAGATGIDALANLGATERISLLRQLQRLQRKAEVLVIDTGAGVSRNVIEFAACADDVLVLTTPEPTSMIDAYATVKLLCTQRLSGGDWPAGCARIRLVVNMADDRQEAFRVARGLALTLKQFLGVQTDRLGYVLRDQHVEKAVRMKKPFLLQFPAARASYCVRSIAELLFDGQAAGTSTDKSPVSAFIKKLARFLVGRSS
jgi:flagellar biosynthesis protein FlhG